MNIVDPSGPIKIGEQWHVFEDSCDWCHYVSDDLINWKQLNNTPFTTITGSIGYPNQGNTVFAFYGVDDQSVVLKATNDFINDPSLQSWNLQGTAYANVDKRPNFRDPARPIYLNGKWYAAVASSNSDATQGEFLWFESDDNEWNSFTQIGSLFNVTHTHGSVDVATCVYNPNLNVSVPTVECVDVFELNDKIVLLASLLHGTQWWVGTIDFDSNVFKPESMGLIDYGSFYAGKTGTTLLQTNDQTLRILFGFAGWGQPDEPTQCGHSFIVPRYVSLSDNSRLQFEPTPEIETLRVDSSYINQIIYQTTKNMTLGVKGSQLQIKFSCLMIEDAIGNVSVNVLASQDNAQYTQIGYNFDKKLFYVNQMHCCSSSQMNNIVQIAPFDVTKENSVSMNILVDASLIESFGNNQIVITSMVNPTNVTMPSERRVVFNGNQALSCQVEAWNLQL